MLDTDGAFSFVQIPSLMSRSLISHANILGFFSLKLVIDSITEGVATFGFEPPIRPGLIDPVEWYLKFSFRIKVKRVSNQKFYL